MARRKRKYIRRKPYKRDTVPMSSLFVGLLPILLMAGVIGIYIFYQYSQVFPTVAIPSYSPDIAFPEMTISFSEVGDSLSSVGMVVLDMILVAADEAVMFWDILAYTWSAGIELLRNGIFAILFRSIISLTDGALQIAAAVTSGIAFTIDTITYIRQEIVFYTRAVSWTVTDFWRYLDISGRVNGFFEAIFSTLQGLNPAPAVTGATQKVSDSNRAIATAFEPLSPIMSYLWENVKETFGLLGQGFTNMMDFLSWLAEESEKNKQSP